MIEEERMKIIVHLFKLSIKQKKHNNDETVLQNSSTSTDYLW
jgi:hypothetical protein